MMGRLAVCRKFGKRVRLLRRQKGLSQEELADLAGIHRTYMGKIERGESNPPLYTIHNISKALNSSLTELFSSI